MVCAAALIWLADLLADVLIYDLSDMPLVDFSLNLRAGLIPAATIGLLVGLVTRLSTAFSISRSTPDRWMTKPVLTGVFGGLAFGLTVGLAESGAAGITFAVTAGLRPALTAGLLIGLVTRLATVLTTNPPERDRGWTAKPVRTGLLAGLTVGLIPELVKGLTDWTAYTPFDGLLTALRSGLTAALFVGLVIRLITVLTTSQPVPRHGWTVRQILVGVLAGLPAGLVMWVAEALVYGTSVRVYVGLANGLTFMTMYAVAVVALARYATCPRPASLIGPAIPLAGVGYGLFFAVMSDPGYGLAIGLTAALAIELTRRLTTDREPAQRLGWTHRGTVLGLIVGITLGLVVAIGNIVVAGLIMGSSLAGLVAIIYGISAAPQITAVRSPAQVLRRDRASFAALTISITLFSIVMVTMVYIAAELPFDDSLKIGLAVGLSYGLVTGIIVATGNTAWGNTSCPDATWS